MPFDYAEKRAAEILRAYHDSDPSGAHEAITKIIRQVLEDAANEAHPGCERCDSAECKGARDSVTRVKALARRQEES